MALSKLSADQHRAIFSQLCNVREPRDAVDFSSISPELRELTQALQQQLRADHEAEKARLWSVLMLSSKELREAREIWISNGPPRPPRSRLETDLATLISLVSVLPALEALNVNEHRGTVRQRVELTDGVKRLMTGLGAGALPALTSLNIDTHVSDAGASALASALGRGALPRLGTLCLRNATNDGAGLVAFAPVLSVLPALKELFLRNFSAGPGGVQRLMAGLGACALPAVTYLCFFGTHVGDAGASAIAAALGRGALPRLKTLGLSKAGIGDAGLVALGLPSLESIYLAYNPLGEEGLAALVAPPPLAGALSLTIRVLTKLKLPTKARVLTKLEVLDLGSTQINNAGCAALASALYGGTLPALKRVNLEGIPASAASKAAVIEALAKSRGYGGFRFYLAIRNFCALYECFEDVARGHNIFAWLWMTAHIFAALALLARDIDGGSKGG
eukprot:scaffold45728_cov55-Phaeocystis_antarctica.AAC.1